MIPLAVLVSFRLEQIMLSLSSLCFLASSFSVFFLPSVTADIAAHSLFYCLWITHLTRLPGFPFCSDRRGDTCLPIFICNVNFFVLSIIYSKDLFSVSSIAVVRNYVMFPSVFSLRGIVHNFECKDFLPKKRAFTFFSEPAYIYL